MTQTVNLTLTPEIAADKSAILKELQSDERTKSLGIKSFKIIRRSIDARKKQIKVNLSLLVSDEETVPRMATGEYSFPKVETDSPQVVIVGAGPAGLFAALRAIELGLRPIVVERGKDVDSRRKEIALISREGKINPESNYCFGEGGAGTFSDGKLYTRSKKRGNNREVLEILHLFGADEDILINSHPHIGSDQLPGIIKAIREKIIESGGEVRFNTKMTGLLLEGQKAVGIETENGYRIYGPVFLATGHSARDTYRLLHKAGIELEAKGLAIGVRVEHPQKLIDQIQYHNKEGRGPWLPPAEYSFVTQADQRGVYTFCMCPGGVVVPAVSDKNQIVVNGMSASFRSGRWANSGLVVELHPGDIEEFRGHGVFEMMELQEALEERFSKASNGSLKAPAQKIKDFLEGRKSEELPRSSYAPGLLPADFHKLFPTEISGKLKKGLIRIGEKAPRFIGEEGIMLGLESRTSSPVRIPRDKTGFHHVQIRDLYPVGEGAGYAGGIVSSAVDGRNAIDAYYKEKIANGIDT